MIDKCSLCGNTSNLCQSHIIPKFVFRWLKETSATGMIRGQKDPNKLYQDGFKTKLLCKICENKFNKWETQFANKIFWPYIKKERDSFDYEEWLTKFIISLNWRLLINWPKEDEVLSKRIQEKLSIAEYRFRKYLLNQRKKYGHYQNNLIFVDYIESANFDVPTGLTRYLGRTIDAIIAYGKKELWMYIKLGKIISITIIYGQKLLDWKDSRIEPLKGTISTKQIICEKLGPFLLNRNEEIKERMKVYDGRYKSKFWKKVMNDPDAFVKTETFRSYLEEERLTGKLPKF